MDVGLVAFGLAGFGGIDSWAIYMTPLLGVSAAYRFSEKAALCMTALMVLALVLYARLTGFDNSYYQVGMWAAIMLLGWSGFTQAKTLAEEAKYRMMYLDQERVNTELEERLKGIDEKIQSHTIIDTATGLKNFRYFRSRIEEEISRARRQKYVFSLILMEVDDMPEFLKMYDELERRKALHRVGVKLRDIFRTSDLIGCYRDNQFLILLPMANARESVGPIIRLRKDLESLGFGPDNRFTFKFSFGVACYPDDVGEVGGMLSLASTALRRSHEKGAGMITLASSLYRKGPDARPV